MTLAQAAPTGAYEVELEPAGLPPVVAPATAWWLRHSVRRDFGRLRVLLELA